MRKPDPTQRSTKQKRTAQRNTAATKLVKEPPHGCPVEARQLGRRTSRRGKAELGRNQWPPERRAQAA